MEVVDLQSCGVPAVCAKEPKGVSEKYTFIPTTRIVADLISLGWHPVKVLGRSGSETAKHVIRFRQPEHLAGGLQEVCPEIVMLNSHDGLSSFRLSAGLFRLVCSNGLVISEAMFASISIRHIRYTYEAVREAAASYADNVPRISGCVQRLRSINLLEAEKFAFANDLMKIRFTPEIVERREINLQKALTPLRTADKGDDLWSVFNVLQEKIINGRVFTVTGEKMRRVTNAERNIRLNQAMFDLAMQYGARKI